MPEIVLYSTSDFNLQCLLAYHEAILVDAYRDDKNDKIYVDFECDFDAEQLVKDYNHNKVEVRLKDWIETKKQVQSYINKKIRENTRSR